MYFVSPFTPGSRSMPIVPSHHTTPPHTEEEDYSVLWNSLREPITLLKNDPDAPHAAGPGGFMHLMGGYDSSYYGYMYSLVFAADMWATVFEKNALDPKLGEYYCIC